MSDTYFKVGKSYCVSKYTTAGTQFFEGEMLTYIGGGFSRFEDGYVYDFTDINGKPREYFSKEEYNHEKEGIFNITQP